MTKPQATLTSALPPASFRPEPAELAVLEAYDPSIAFGLGFRPAASRAASPNAADKNRPAKQLLGSDFSHVIVAR